jgi:hypothetical protein
MRDALTGFLKISLKFLSGTARKQHSADFAELSGD